MKRGAIGLPVTLDVEGRTAVVYGGGAEADDKVERLLDAGAVVRVVAESPSENLRSLGAAGRIVLEPGARWADALGGACLALVCEVDAALATRVFDAAIERGVLVWCCDDPPRSELAMPALARLGRARVAISTAGGAPALASSLRRSLERDLGPRFADFVDHLTRERARIFAEEPDPAARRLRVRALLDGFAARVEVTYPDWFSAD